MDKGSAVIHLYRRNCIDHKETPMVNNRFRTVIVSLFLSTICAMVFAEEAEKLKVTPTGRIFIDGASFFTPQKDYFPDGIAIPDVRLGVMMNYEKWSASINIGFNQSKVGLEVSSLGIILMTVYSSEWDLLYINMDSEPPSALPHWLR